MEKTLDIQNVVDMYEDNFGQYIKPGLKDVAKRMVKLALQKFVHTSNRVRWVHSLSDELDQVMDGFNFSAANDIASYALKQIL